MTPEQYRALRLQIAAQLMAADINGALPVDTVLGWADELIAANEARPVPSQQEVK